MSNSLRGALTGSARSAAAKAQAGTECWEQAEEQALTHCPGRAVGSRSERKLPSPSSRQSAQVSCTGCETCRACRRNACHALTYRFRQKMSTQSCELAGTMEGRLWPAPADSAAVACGSVRGWPVVTRMAAMAAIAPHIHGRGHYSCRSWVPPKGAANDYRMAVAPTACHRRGVADRGGR